MSWSLMKPKWWARLCSIPRNTPNRRSWFGRLWIVSENGHKPTRDLADSAPSVDEPPAHAALHREMLARDFHEVAGEGCGRSGFHSEIYGCSTG